jgi:hypothetical protein
MSSAELLAVADRLYAGPAATFTPRRDQEAKACADKELAARIKGLRKPSTAAWAINLLVRREGEQIDQVLAIAGSLRVAAASMDGDELRALTRQRRQLTAALTSSARDLVRLEGVRLTTAVADQVEAMLTAAMLDPRAAEVVRSGLVVTAFASTGLSELDVAAVCAVPEVAGHVAAATEPCPPMLHVVPDDGVRVAVARDRVTAAEIAAAGAREELDHLTVRVENLNARRLQLQGELEELRRRLAGLEDDVERLDDELEEADESLDVAQGAHEEAEAGLAAARRELDRLGG